LQPYHKNFDYNVGVEKKEKNIKAIFLNLESIVIYLEISTEIDMKGGRFELNDR